MTHDPLIKRVRKTLRSHPEFSDWSSSELGVPCVFSTEPPIHPGDSGLECAATGLESGSMRMDCNDGYGSATFVTGTFGFFAAAEAIRFVMEPQMQTKNRGC